MGQKRFFWTDELDIVIRDLALKNMSLFDSLKSVADSFCQLVVEVLPLP